MSHRTRWGAVIWAFTKGRAPDPAAIQPPDSTATATGAPPSQEGTGPFPQSPDQVVLLDGCQSPSPTDPIVAPPIADHTRGKRPRPPSSEPAVGADSTAGSISISVTDSDDLPLSSLRCQTRPRHDSTPNASHQTIVAYSYILHRGSNMPFTSLFVVLGSMLKPGLLEIGFGRLGSLKYCP